MRAVLALLRLASLRHASRAPGRTALTIAGVAIGVAALVSMDLVNASSAATIEELISAYAGRAQLTVRAASGTLDPSALPTIRSTAGVGAAAGSIQGALVVGAGQREILPFIAGIGDEEAVRDQPLSRGTRPSGDEIAIGPGAARRLGLDVGATLRALTPAGIRDLRVSGILAERGLGRANAGWLALLPYPTADRLYGRDGRLDAVDVVLSTGARPDELARRIRSALRGAEVETPEARATQTKKLVAGLQTLLQVVSALSLFIGVFLVFNTISIAVAQRRRDFGILRALGARRIEIVAMVVAESAAVGVAASVLGLALGVLLARGLLATVNEQIRASFVAGLADQLSIDALRLAGLGILGVGAAILGGLGPALAAARTPAAEAIAAPRHAATARPLRLRLLLPAAAFAGLAVAAIAAQGASRDAGPGSFAAFALMLAIATAAAPVVALGVRAIGPLAERLLGLPARLARDSVLRSPGRAAVTAAALSSAIAMVVGMASFIESDRRAIFQWLDQAVNADLFVSAAPLGSSSGPTPLDPALADRIRSIPGVRAVDLFRQVRISVGETFAALASVDIPTYLLRGRPVFAPGSEPYDIARMVGRDELFVSDNFARYQGVRQGDTIALRTPDGPRDFKVVAVAVDYTTDQGLLFMDRTTYVRSFHDTAVDAFAVMVDGPAHVATVRDELERLEGGALFVQTNAEFKDGIRKIVDDFFSTTYVMEAIALLVGVLGIANTMAVAVLERRREIGVLRAVGATRPQIRRTVLIEAATIGAWGAVLGGLGGAALAYIVFVVTERTTGWVFPLLYSWETAVSVTVLATAAALLAGWWPARTAARQQVATALAYE